MQHAMQNNQVDIIVSGDFIRNLQLDNGNLFRAFGPGSLQGNDVKEGLIVALNDPIMDDTYTEIPLIVDDMGISTPQGPPATTTPVQQQTQRAPPHMPQWERLSWCGELWCGAGVRRIS